MNTSFLSRVFAASAVTLSCLIPFATHAAPNFTPSTPDLPRLTLGQAATIDITLNRTGHALVTLTSGALPDGVSIANVAQNTYNSVITLGGTPTREGTFNFHLIASTPTDIYQQDYRVEVWNPFITIAPPAIVRGRVGWAYLQPLTTSGSVLAPLNWSVSADFLPYGIGIDSTTGALSGTPTTAGTYSFTVMARDAAGRVGTQRYTIIVEPADAGSTPTPGTGTVSPVTITTRANPVDGRVGEVYSTQIFRASGGSAPYRWTTTGTVPPGLTLDASSGILSGTPTTAGRYGFTIQANDAAGAHDQLDVSVNIAGVHVATLPPDVILTNPIIPVIPTLPDPLTPLTPLTPTPGTPPLLPVNPLLPLTPTPVVWTPAQQRVIRRFEARYRVLDPRINASWSRILSRQRLEDQPYTSNGRADWQNARAQYPLAMHSPAAALAALRSADRNLLNLITQLNHDLPSIPLVDGVRAEAIVRAEARSIRVNMRELAAILSSVRW